MVRGVVSLKHASHTAFGALVPLVLLVAACGQGSGGAACLPEDVQRCTCEEGRTGFRVCDPAAASGYGACRCDLDASPYLPSPGAEDAGDGGASGEGGSHGGLTFMSPCNPADDQCPPGTSCDSFPAKGPHCSKPCKVATDCPAPSPGCSMMGICRSP